MSQKLRFTKEVSEFIKMFTAIRDGEGNMSYHIPYWFAGTKDKCVFEIVENKRQTDEFNRETEVSVENEL